MWEHPADKVYHMSEVRFVTFDPDGYGIPISKLVPKMLGAAKAS